MLISDQSASDLTTDIANAFSAVEPRVGLISGKQGSPRLSAAVYLKKIRAYDRSSTLNRIKTWLAGTWGIFRLLKDNGDTEFLITSNPPLAPLLPLLRARKFSLLIWDIWPDALVHTRTLSAGNPLVRAWKFLNKKAFARAEQIFTISEGMAEILAQYAPRERISVIPCWADVKLLKPMAKAENRFIKAHGLGGKFVVMYSGNIGNTHRVEALVDIAKKLRDIDDIVFVIIGEGGKKELVKRRVAESGLTNVVMLPFQPREMLPHSLAAADVGVVTLDETSSQVSVPSKTYSMLAVGAPLLCLAGEKSELAKLVGSHDVGACFSPDAVSEAANWLRALKNSPSRHRELSANARATSLLFSPENAKKYVAALRRAASNPARAEKGERVYA